MYYLQNQPLSKETLLLKAPSVFNDNPHPDLSHLYQTYPTINFIDDIAKQGWYPVQAVEVHVRDKDRQGYQKHMIRFEHPNCRLSEKEFLQLLLVNSTDGRCSYQISLGIWRLICSNGMIVGDQFCSSPKIRHVGHTYQDIIDVSNQVLEQAPVISENMNIMKSISLITDERIAFAKAATELVIDNDSGKVIDPSELLRLRHYEDRNTESSLWTTFNLVQENITKGRIHIKDKDSKAWDYGRKMRAIKSIDRDVKINKALWVLAEEMKKIKTV